MAREIRSSFFRRALVACSRGLSRWQGSPSERVLPCREPQLSLTSYRQRLDTASHYLAKPARLVFLLSCPLQCPGTLLFSLQPQAVQSPKAALEIGSRPCARMSTHFHRAHRVVLWRRKLQILVRWWCLILLKESAHAVLLRGCRGV